MSNVITYQRFWQRRDTEANWTAANPVLAAGEFGVEIDDADATLLRLKLGDGLTAWNALGYHTPPVLSAANLVWAGPVSGGVAAPTFRTLVAADVPDLSGTYQQLDTTLTALAGANWAANAVPIGSGADTLAQVAFAANTFPGRASTGNLVAKAITDNALTLLSTTTTDNLPEATNLYFTDARARAAAIAAAITDGDTTHAPDGNAVFDALALKAPLASPTLTGTPAAPTAAATTDTTQLATTAFVHDVMPKGYIDGLIMQWVSATAVTVTSGSAYIESLGRVLDSPSAIAKTSLSLSASTWYHLYLYDNAGTPAVEVVTTAPATAYSGTARSKTSDTTRRYVGSILTDASSNVYNFAHAADDAIRWQIDTRLAPFRCLTAGVATVQTTVALSGAVPPTTRTAHLNFINTDAAAAILLGNSTASVFPIHVIRPLAGVFGQFMTDASQAIIYSHNVAPSGGSSNIDVLGYGLER